MDVAELLTDAFGRVAESVHAVLQDADQDELVARLDEDANSIGWLVWHLTRVEDDHVAGVAGSEQVWMSDGWCDRFALPFDPLDTGYGHYSSQVASVCAETSLLRGYFDAVNASVLSFVSSLSPGDLDRVVDRSWDPPVTLGARLVSVVTDAVAHIGQAEMALGVLRRRSDT